MPLLPLIANFLSSGIVPSVGSWLSNLFPGQEDSGEAQRLRDAAAAAEAEKQQLETILIVGGIAAGALIIVLLVVKTKKSRR